MTELEGQIREKAAAFLAGEISAVDLEQTLLPLMACASTSSSWTLGWDILRLLAEYDHGDWEKAELKLQLNNALHHVNQGREMGVQTGTSSATTHPLVAIHHLSFVAGKRHEAVLG